MAGLGGCYNCAPKMGSLMQSTRRPGARGAKPLSEFMAQAIAKVAKRQGFGQAGVLLYWDEIVGERLAEMAQPLKLVWPPRRWNAEGERVAAPASLILQVESAFTLEVQHLAPLIIERVNAHFGWACVGRILLKHGPLATRTPARLPLISKPSPAAEMAARLLVGALPDERLRLALTRLGSHVLSPSEASLSDVRA